eukprot:7239138-Prymnesium_polylepis.2
MESTKECDNVGGVLPHRLGDDQPPSQLHSYFCRPPRSGMSGSSGAGNSDESGGSAGGGESNNEGGGRRGSAAVAPWCVTCRGTRPW